VFPTAVHLASWAGVVPGCHESAGRVKSATTRPGNRHLKAALGVAALSAARTKDTYYSARHRRIGGRRRPVQSRRNKHRGSSIAGMIALVAVEHTMLTDAWHMLVNGAFYRDPAPTTTPATNPGEPRPKPSSNWKPSDTKPLSNHSPTPRNTRVQPTHPLRVTTIFE
jgi:transposase